MICSDLSLLQHFLHLLLLLLIRPQSTYKFGMGCERVVAHHRLDVDQLLGHHQVEPSDVSELLPPLLDVEAAHPVVVV